MGRAPAAGARGIERRAGGVVPRQIARRTARGGVERVDSANEPALFRDVAHVDDGYFSHAIQRVGNLLSLAQLAVPARTGNAAKIFLALASRRMAGGCMRLLDERAGGAGNSVGGGFVVAGYPPENIHAKAAFPREPAHRIGAVPRVGGAVV